MTRPLDALVRPSRFWPPRDREDVAIPHKLESIGALKAVPHLMSFFSTVIPDEFWIETSETQTSVPSIVVSCPCGAEPTLTFGLRSFSFAECDCGRCFMHDGEHVRVGRAQDDEQSPEPA